MVNEQWVNTRNELLKLHKVLLEFESRAYEGQHGKVAGPGVMLGLVMEYPSFAWLRQLSEAVVGLDELLDSKEQTQPQKYKDMLSYIKKLVVPSLRGNTFAKNYYQAIHADPAVALAHSKAQQALQKISL